MDSQGTRSQIPTLVAGVVVAAAVIFLGWFLALLLNAVLAGIVTGADALRGLLDVLEKQKTIFAITRASEPIPQLLHTYELMERIGEEHLYATNREAANAFQRASGSSTATRKTT